MHRDHVQPDPAVAHEDSWLTTKYIKKINKIASRRQQPFKPPPQAENDAADPLAQEPDQEVVEEAARPLGQVRPEIEDRLAWFKNELKQAAKDHRAFIGLTACRTTARAST